jgi:general secretion pathway protein M
MLAKREKNILIGGGIFLFLLLFYNFAIAPLRERIEILEGKIQGREEDRREIIKLRDDYLAFRRDLKLVEEGLATRGEGFSLFSFLEGLTVETGIKDRLVSMEPRERHVSNYYKESTVEIRLKNIEMSELVNYLYRIENPPRFLIINDLLVRPQRGSPGRVEVSFEVSTLIPR